MSTDRFKGNIFVSNLPEDFSAAELASLFDDFGLVLGAKIMRPFADRAPVGLVAVAPQTAAEKAVEELDGHLVGSRKIKVQKAKEEERPAKPAPQAKPAAKVARVRKAEPAASVTYVSSMYSVPKPATRAARPLIVERRPLRRV